MTYPESFVAPMREELARLGIEELRTAEAVDARVKDAAGTLMVVVNSICGCAAGKARPGIALALQHSVRPDRVATVFAGADLEATRSRAQLLHRLRAVIAVDWPATRRTVGVDARAATNRESGA